MGDWTRLPSGIYSGMGLVTISVSSKFSIFQGQKLATSYASAAWPSANLAIYIPFRVASPVKILTLFWMNGTGTQSNNCDIGIFTADGTKIASSGNTAKSGASAIQSVNPTTQPTIGPGLYYWGISNSGTQNFVRCNVFAGSQLRLMGVSQQASANALPATWTPASMAQQYIPFIGMTARSVL